jgi:hypothetical protein
MNTRRFMLAAATAGVAGLLAYGCNRQGAAKQPAGPATQPVVAQATEPTTDPAGGDSDVATTAAEARPAAAQSTATQPVGCSFLISDGNNPRLYDFPAARLRISKDGDKYATVLYTDDPKTAINPDYAGNSFYLKMMLDIDGPTKLSGADWQFTAPTSEHREADDGIFLDGNRVHLQTSDVNVSFKDQSAHTVQVLVWGQFRKFDADHPTSPGKLMTVHGEFLATVDVAK